MKVIKVIWLLLIIQTSGIAQVQFVERLELETKFNESDFLVINMDDGLLGFRTVPEKGFNLKSKLQFFTTDFQLQSDGLHQISLKDNFDLVSYDLENNFFYAMMQKSSSVTGDRYMLEINLATNDVHEIGIDNVLPMELREFFVLNRKLIFMGISEMRPVVQIFDIATSNVFTVQGIYTKDARILQLRKDPDLGVFDVLISKRDKFKIKQISLLTFDDLGNKIREVIINKLEDPGMEIVEGLLTPINNYQQALIGVYGQRKREAFQGIFLTEINEFGEYKNRYYTLEDFPNFYNYMNEKSLARKHRELDKAFGKGKIPSIRPVFSTREVITLDQGYLIYSDHFSATNPRYIQRDGVYANSIYRINPYNPYMTGMYNDPFFGYGGYPRSYSSVPREGEYKFMSAHLLLLDNRGKVIWDNALKLSNRITSNPSKFGEISYDGEKLHYMYLEGTEMHMSYIKNGEVIFENEPFDLELINENERIRETQENSLRLNWWFANYYLVSGKQKIRYQNESGKEENRDVYFLSKIKVDGDFYVPDVLD